jgi:hypothetical protein
MKIYANPEICKNLLKSMQIYEILSKSRQKNEKSTNIHQNLWESVRICESHASPSRQPSKPAAATSSNNLSNPSKPKPLAQQTQASHIAKQAEENVPIKASPASPPIPANPANPTNPASQCQSNQTKQTELAQSPRGFGYSSYLSNHIFQYGQDLVLIRCDSLSNTRALKSIEIHAQKPSKPSKPSNPSNASPSNASQQSQQAKQTWNPSKTRYPSRSPASPASPTNPARSGLHARSIRVWKQAFLIVCRNASMSLANPSIQSSTQKRSAAEAVACKSAAVRSAPPAGVLGAIVEKLRLTS